MPIEEHQITTHELDYRCDSCGKGNLRPTGVMLLSDPPKWPHACTECGAQQTFDTKYPAFVYRRVDAGAAGQRLDY